MKVTEQRDGETIHLRRPAGQPKLLPHNARAIWLHQDCVASNRQRARGGRSVEKLPSCDGG